MKTLIESLGKYATAIPADSPPGISPMNPDDVWGLQNAASIAVGLLVEGGTARPAFVRSG